MAIENVVDAMVVIREQADEIKRVRNVNAEFRGELGRIRGILNYALEGPPEHYKQLIEDALSGVTGADNCKETRDLITQLRARVAELEAEIEELKLDLEQARTPVRSTSYMCMAEDTIEDCLFFTDKYEHCDHLCKGKSPQECPMCQPVNQTIYVGDYEQRIKELEAEIKRLKGEKQ